MPGPPGCGEGGPPPPPRPGPPPPPGPPSNHLPPPFNRPDSHPCVEFWDDEGYPRGDHTPSEDE